LQPGATNRATGFFVQRLRSEVEPPGSHSIYVSQPRVVADLIEKAARQALAAEVAA
jgi:hypothetical protein